MLTNIFKEPKVLHTEVHKDLTLSPYKNYEFTKDVFLCPITLEEMLLSSKSYIIVFIKDENIGLIPSIVLGGEESGNLLLNEDQNFKEGYYVPASLRSYPFGIGSNEKENFIMIDEKATICNQEDGQRIIDDEFKFTKIGEETINFVKSVYSQIEKTKEMFAEVEKYGIFAQASIVIEKGKEKHNLTKGIYVVDEVALNKLESRKIKKLATTGMLKFVYAHLLSLNNRY
jgi:hypothetical protein